jgi:hypothetical protein
MCFEYLYGSLVIYFEDAWSHSAVKMPVQRQHLWVGLERVAAAVLGVEEPKKGLEKHWKNGMTWYHWLEYKKGE